MSMIYNYLLYFKRHRLWDVLQGLVNMCNTEAMKSTTIHFPDHDLVLPLMSSWGQGTEHAFDKPKYEFALSMIFDEDEPILDYLNNRDGDRYDRSPPDETGIRQVAIGYIYLTVYADLSKHFALKYKPTDLVLFQFGTSVSLMSFLFSDSTSIRKTFINLLRRFNGVTGVFDREIDGGELFWFKGKEMSLDVGCSYVLPDEIEETIRRGW